MSQELLRSEITQGLMGTDGVIGPFPGLEFVIELGDRERARGDFIKLLRVGAIGALHLAIKFGRARGQHEQTQAALLTGFFEESGKLTTAIHLQSAQGKGQTTLQGVEEKGGRRGGGSAMDFNHIPARDHVTSRELLQHHAGRRPQVHGVELHQVSGLLHRIILGVCLKTQDEPSIKGGIRVGMSQEIRANYDQLDLLPPSLEDWVAADHPARFIREFVDALDRGALGFRRRESEEGRPNYAADLLLKVWLYGYLTRIRSTRDLERACREHLSLLWLTGRHAPDHNTLWRFWKENREGLRRVFRQVVKVAAANGLVGMICHAVDGTKIRAVSSRRTMEHREELEHQLERVEASIREMEQAVEDAEEREAGEYRLPQELQEAHQLRQAIRSSLEQMQEVKREHRHPGEPEARMMPCEGRKELAYNAQAVVDQASGLIVAEDVVNEESDNRRLVPMLDEVKGNLGAVAEETLADGGYKSSVGLGEAEAKGYSVLVHLGGDAAGQQAGPYHTSRFRYQAEQEAVICPQGKKLEFEAVRTNRGKRYAVRGYRCRSFRSCPVRGECSRNPAGRLIEISPYHAAVEKQRQKQHDVEKQKLFQKRKVIVEPVFGIIKQARGFRRWTVRGMENVQTQWSLICSAFNLKKIYQVWAPRQRAWV